MASRQVLVPASVKAALAEVIRSVKAERVLIIAVTAKILTSRLFSEMTFFHNLPAVELPVFRALAAMHAVRAKAKILPIPCG